MTTFKELEFKRESALKRLDCALKRGQACGNNPESIPRFESWCERLDDTVETFNSAHIKILCLLKEPSDIEFHNAYQEQADDLICEILELKRKYIVTKTKDSSDTKCRTLSTTTHVKLPLINLPSFSGKLKEFPAYIDLFNTLVHKRTDLSNVEKFQYLISTLSGEPVSIIRAYPISDSNYISAYESLKSRYNNKRYLAFLCWEDIINSKSATIGSASALRKTLDLFCENLSILKSLGLPTDNWNFILFHTLLTKVDKRSREAFELFVKSSDFPDYAQLQSFLTERCLALERSANTHDTGMSELIINKRQSNKPATTLLTQTYHCAFCSKNHLIFFCNEFKAKSPQERYKIIENNHLCLNCLRSNHTLKDCRSDHNCKLCNQRHNTLLHFPSQSSHLPSNVTEFKSAPIVSHHDNTIKPLTTLSNIESKTFNCSQTFVVLATAEVDAKDKWGQYQTVRILLDPGSQSNIITERCVRKLGLPRFHTNISMSGVGEIPTKSNYKVQIEIKSKIKTNIFFVTEAVTLERICSDMPTHQINPNHYNHLSNVLLADPRYHQPRDVDILIGGELFPQILLPGKIHGSAEIASAINTVFGWVLMGKTITNDDSSNNIVLINQVFTLNDNQNLDSAIQNLWEVEKVPSYDKSDFSIEDQQCESIYQTTHRRDLEGRYIVRLPFRNNNVPKFNNSYSIALRRFLHLENRLVSNPSFYKEYTDHIMEYLTSGQMELIPPNECKSSSAYYIPHHAVMKPDSLTTKLRVVFDASAKDTTGQSLNDTLLTGCKLQSNIISILLRFRIHNIVFIADIKQMYRRIIITEEHRDYQRIIFRRTRDEPLQEYKLNRVTFGVSSAPFLAIRTMHQLAADEQNSFPIASKIILNDLYVDDVVSGCDTIDEALNIQNQLIGIMSAGGFELRKWCSNDKSVLQNIPKEYQASSSMTFGDDRDFIKVLGLKWNAVQDTFTYHINCVNRPCTKRTMLSELARIYDPIGFVSPLTFLAKSLIQKVWLLGIAWDVPVPSEINNIWVNYIQQLPNLAKVKIDRKISHYSSREYQLHGFCDASETGYAAVVYLRCTTEDKSNHVALVSAKSRVSPVKRITLPRLELCGASLLADLMHFIIQTFSSSLSIVHMYAWSDSMIVLSWLQSSSSHLKVFVGNRIANIHRKIPNAIWKHVPTKENPADCASRGLLPDELINHQLWWKGPRWLTSEYSSWPTTNLNSNPNIKQEVLKEQKPMVLVSTTESNFIDDLIHRYSSLHKIQRILGYILRFINNSKIHNHINNKSKLIKPFTENELHHILMFLVKHLQQSSFNEQLSFINKGKRLPKSFRRLDPFIDDDGVLRVGGRLSKSKLSFNEKHPALLPCTHRLTDLIIQSVHNQNLHPGLQTVQYLLLQNFWILSSKRAIRRVISKCYQCFRVQPQHLQPKMADLPRDRVIQNKAFQTVGVDYAGPFSILINRYRGARTTKAYICIFVCFTTKAVHLELSSDLSSDSFLAALRRFISRRGRCNVIHSDCGTNFKGAQSHLLSLMSDACVEERIEFKFNPPGAPHFGGLWEAGVKSVKTHLNRVIGMQILTYEEFNTLLTQIEAILNSRPLCPLSSDPNDLNVLTPGHFLTLAPLTTVPTPDYSNNSCKLTRWQLIQHMHQDFWSRWHKEYLVTLTQRSKWLNAGNPPKIDQVVLIKDELTHPLRWRFGRIVKLYIGTDGIARCASVRTSNNLIERPLVKLCPIPNECE